MNSLPMPEALPLPELNRLKKNCFVLIRSKIRELSSQVELLEFALNTIPDLPQEKVNEYKFEIENRNEFSLFLTTLLKYPNNQN